MRVAIIGGGLGGLTTAYFLQRRGRVACETTIFEASPRPGGKIMTRQFANAPILHEAGAAELYDYSQLGPDRLRELVHELGLTTRPMFGSAVIITDQLLKSADDARFACGEATDQALRDFTSKARCLITPANYYESDWQEDNDDPLAHQSFDEFLANVPDLAAQKYIRVLVHSDLATEPHQTNALFGLHNFLLNDQEYMRLYTIEGGIEKLPRAIAQRLSARILLNQAVVRVERTNEETYRVTSRSLGEIQTEDFDFVVAALPNNWIPAIDWAGDRLAKAMHQHHKHYDYPAHYLRVSILFRAAFWRDHVAGSYFMLDAFGGCCVYDESPRNGDGQYGVLGWLLAGEAALTLTNLADAALIDQVLDFLPASLRHGRELFLEGRVYRWVGSVTGLPGGVPMHHPEVRHVPEPIDHPWLFVAGDYLFDSTLSGVVNSAQFVAAWILEEIEDDERSDRRRA